VHRIIFTLIILISLHSLLNSELIAQTTDSTELNKTNWHIYPVAFYTPETDFAFGGLSILLFRLSEQIESKPSNIRFLGYYTLNSQYSFSIKPEIYFNNDKCLLLSEIYYSKIADKFYGAGNNTAEIDNPEYDYRNLYFEIQPQYEFIKNLRAGLIYEFRDIKIRDVRENPYLLSGEVKGNNGGISSGLGIASTYDSRDNIFYPSTGGYYVLSYTFFEGFFGSDFDFIKAYLDLRRFFNISENQVLAYHFYYNFINGTAPFYEIPPLGGEELMRGYYSGRYRDKNYFATQVEYRIRVWWKFGLVGFIGMGDVAPDISKFEIKRFKYSYGCGIRLRIDDVELIDLRLDIGLGKNTSEFYFSYNQAF
jgi:outer membrane protein assembly factor BamA